MSTSLYLVPTPIGNLGDITYRAVEVLRQVDVILAEDTRTTGVLLKKYTIDTPLKSYHIHNEHRQTAHWIAQMQAGTVVAQVSDAGTPGISDPGYLLVRAALTAGLQVEALPGATAFVPALLKSGLPADRFVFEGFLPHKKGRQTRLKQLAEEPRTIILYESPHRLERLLDELAQHCGPQRQISVSRELTKLHEETLNGSVAELQQIFAEKKPKGEFVVVVAGKD